MRFNFIPYGLGFRVSNTKEARAIMRAVKRAKRKRQRREEAFLAKMFKRQRLL